MENLNSHFSPDNSPHQDKNGKNGVNND